MSSPATPALISANCVPVPGILGTIKVGAVGKVKRSIGKEGY